MSFQKKIEMNWNGRFYSQKHNNMDYKNAVKNMLATRRKRNAKNPFRKLQNLPKGWIYIKNNKKGEIKFYDNRTIQEIEYDEEKEINDSLWLTFVEHMDRRVKHKTLELLRDNYSEEEVEYCIENLINEVFEDEEAEEEDNDTDYDSENTNEDDEEY
jgi:hypothetical protein